VHLMDAVPVLILDVEEVDELGDTRVVDDAVQTAARLDSPGDDGLDVHALRYVGRDEGGADVGGELLSLVFLQVRHQDLGTARCHGRGDGRADSLRAPGDDDGLPIEIGVHPDYFLVVNKTGPGGGSSLNLGLMSHT